MLTNIDRQTDKDIDNQTDEQIERWTLKAIDRQKDGQTRQQIDRQINIRRGEQRDMQIKQIWRNTDRQKERFQINSNKIPYNGTTPAPKNTSEANTDRHKQAPNKRSKHK